MLFAVVAGACAPNQGRQAVGTAKMEAVARLGTTVQLGSTTLTPLTVEEDSRCPMDVQCIQAGTVRVQVRVHVASQNRVTSVGSGTPVQLATGWLHLAAVCPPRLTTTRISPSDYVLTFKLLPSAAPSQLEVRCY
jgi:hypothetical protein